MKSINDVHSYWDWHPLLAFEVGDVGADERWQYPDHIKRTDVEAFAINYWGFESPRGKTLLDIGCGPGWLTVMYARNGATVTAVDLTEQAIELTSTALSANGVDASVQVASAESLPFPDQSFDVVVSSGVLHHTPDVGSAIREAYRVTREGGDGLITLYRLGILHHRMVFPLVRTVMHITGIRHPGANLASTSRSVEEFVRQYDGVNTPVGIANSERDWETDLTSAGWTVVSREWHYFPSRMVPFLTRAPRWLRKILDRYFATMVYFRLRRV